MAWKSLSDFVRHLEEQGQLQRIATFVSPTLEMAEIADRVSKTAGGGKALLFENTGTDFPVLMNMLGSDKRISMALNRPSLDMLSTEIHELMHAFSQPANGLLNKLRMIPRLRRISTWMPVSSNGKAPCQEVVHREPDLSILPILKCWPFDGGPFITLPVVVTRDPETGSRNVGMYRMQVFDRNTTGMHWHQHKTGARHYEVWKKGGKKMPVSVVLGGDPAITYAATAPLPDQMDEFMLAGFLRKKRVETVRCLTNELEVPACADIVIEGYVDPSEDKLWEGPFGDHTGFYSLPDWYPAFHVTCITHRREAIFPATLVGVPPQEDTYIAKATTRIFFSPVKMAILPEISDMEIPPEGVGHNLTIVQIKKRYPGQAFKSAQALWGAGQMMFNKILIITDENLGVRNYPGILERLNSHFDPSSDIEIARGPLDVLDHAAPRMAFGSKMCLDLTEKIHGEPPTQTQAPALPLSEASSEAIKARFPFVNAISNLEGIPAVLCLTITKQTDSLKDLKANLFTINELTDIKCVLLIDRPTLLSAPSLLLWYAMNNLDPLRDTTLIKKSNGQTAVIWDACRKHRTIDAFERPWPNVACSDEHTIRAIDEKWARLGFPENTASESPSLQLIHLNDKTGAFAAD